MAKIVYRIIAFLVSFSVMLLMSPGFIQLLKLPHNLSVQLIVAFVLATLCTIIYHVMSERLSQIAEETELHPEDQGWA